MTPQIGNRNTIKNKWLIIEKLAQERKEREKEWEEKSAALEREARWYPWVACSIILFAVVALIVKHFF
ncbi:hypothetical protein [Moraxella catarrhalis]|uniref:hypothetical protein n=1 Tax=Moraxella catarrhalis TaxID=480 RepID=UPI001D0D8963|nr:hypothetical protein [Moraxella catarrhalis]